jgi:hypothetical protein
MQDQREGTGSGSSGPQHNQGQELSWGFIANIADTPGFEYQDGLCFIFLPKIQCSFLNILKKHRKTVHAYSSSCSARSCIPPQLQRAWAEHKENQAQPE